MPSKNDDFEEIAIEFFKKQKIFKKAQESFNEAKSFFNDKAEEFFKQRGLSKVTFVTSDICNDSLVIKRIQRKSIEFDADRLEKALGSLSSSVISKHYEVIDFVGLVNYLKELKANPKVFRSFIKVTKKVDEKELDRLEALGKISADQIKGCYTLKCRDPYFTIDLKRGQSNGEQEQ